jgi:lantibiotic modifying enzyme
MPPLISASALFATHSGTETAATGWEHNLARANTRVIAPISSIAPLVHELYSGTSGVSLFLAELYRVTGDPAFRVTALGAIRHAFSRLDSIPASVRIGLFTGWTGIALVSARIAILLNDAFLFDQARDLAQGAVAVSGHP